MNKVFIFSIVLIMCGGCTQNSKRASIAYDHPEFGRVSVSDQIYIDSYGSCEARIYSKPITVGDNQITTKRELDNINKNFESHFGSTVYKKGYKDWEIMDKWEEYKKDLPKYYFEIEELNKEHMRCMWDKGFSPTNRVRLAR